MGEGGMGTPDVGRRVCGGVYRRWQPEGSLLYRAVQENLATLREEAAEMGRGCPVRGAGLLEVPGVRRAGAQLCTGAVRGLQGRAAGGLLLQGPGRLPLV